MTHRHAKNQLIGFFFGLVLSHGNLTTSTTTKIYIGDSRKTRLEVSLIDLFCFVFGRKSNPPNFSRFWTVYWPVVWKIRRINISPKKTNSNDAVKRCFLSWFKQILANKKSVITSLLHKIQIEKKIMLSFRNGIGPNTFFWLPLKLVVQNYKYDTHIARQSQFKEFRTQNVWRLFEKVVYVFFRTEHLFYKPLYFR